MTSVLHICTCGGARAKYRIPPHFQMGRKETKSMRMVTATISNLWERGWEWRKVVIVIVAHPLWKRRGRLRKRTGGGRAWSWQPSLPYLMERGDHDHHPCPVLERGLRGQGLAMTSALLVSKCAGVHATTTCLLTSRWEENERGVWALSSLLYQTFGKRGSGG
mgnify:CR=1 FL=1